LSSEEDKLLEDGEEHEGEMSFLQHLEELRWRFVYSLIGIVIGTIITWIFIDLLVESILLLPAKKANISLQNLRPFGQLFLFMQIAITGGIILSIPNIFYQLWKFIAPALKQKEKKYITLIVVFSTICFLAGIAFAYFLMCSEDITNKPDTLDYKMYYIIFDMYRIITMPDDFYNKPGNKKARRVYFYIILNKGIEDLRKSIY